MRRTLQPAATVLLSICVAGPLAAQTPYPGQPYPPQQPYPAQQAPAQYPPPQQATPQQPPAQAYPQQQPPQPYPQQPPVQAYPQQQPPQAYPPQQAYPQQGYRQQPAPQQYPGAYGPPSPYVPAAQLGVPPAATPFGAAGQIILSADRLFGVSFWSDKVESDSATDTTSGTAINLLWGSDSSASGPYSTPRLGFDYTVAPKITVGGALGIIASSGTHEPVVGPTTDTPSRTAFAIAPRGGYILDINPTIFIWLRGGFTFYTVKTVTTSTLGTATNTDTVTADGFALNLEPQLVIAPVPHFGVTLGPVADIPLSGSRGAPQTGNADAPSLTEKISNFGLVFGVLGHI